MRLIDPKDFSGTQTVRMLTNCVAGQRPRSAGEIVEVPSYEAFELICMRSAEKVIEPPKLALVG
jgi:hypothetical protein